MDGKSINNSRLLLLWLYPSIEPCALLSFTPSSSSSFSSYFHSWWCQSGNVDDHHHTAYPPTKRCILKHFIYPSLTQFSLLFLDVCTAFLYQYGTSLLLFGIFPAQSSSSFLTENKNVRTREFEAKNSKEKFAITRAKLWSFTNYILSFFPHTQEKRMQMMMLFTPSSIFQGTKGWT